MYLKDQFIKYACFLRVYNPNGYNTIPSFVKLLYKRETEFYN